GAQGLRRAGGADVRPGAVGGGAADRPAAARAPRLEVAGRRRPAATAAPAGEPAAGLAGPQADNGLADQVAPLLAQAGPVGFGRPGQREPRAPGPPAREPDPAPPG